MKRTYLLILCLLAGITSSLHAQDTLYVMKGGVIDFRHALSDIDSLSFKNSFNPNLLERLAKDNRFTLFNQALKETGYADLIANTPKQDTAYDYRNCPWALRTYNIKEEYPLKRWFGFTILMESDSILANYKDCPLCPGGIRNLNDLELLAKYWYSTAYKGIYSDGDGVTNRKDSTNFLNRYIAYHVMDSKLFQSRFINDFDTPNQIKTFDLVEYKETMLSNTLLQVKKMRNPASTNLLNYNIANDLSTAVHFTGVTFFGFNGFCHGVDKPLVYSRDVYDYLSTNRLRMDVSSFFKEFANNNMRGNNPNAENVVGKAHRYVIPSGYCDNMRFTPTTRMTYLNANGIYLDYEGDELYVEGTYDFTVTTLPIPAGTYEIRFGYAPNSWLGTVQMYIDDEPAGLPVNFALLANNPMIGWEKPGSITTDPLGYANDSILRTRGYMKGPSSYRCTIGLYYDPTLTARTSVNVLRRIMGTYTFAKPGKHTIRFQSLGASVGDVQFMLDYFEFVPVAILPEEGVN